MKKMLRLVVLLGLAGFAQAQNFLTITANTLQNSEGVPLATGYIQFTPVDANGFPTSYRAGGGGQVTRAAVKCNVAAGAIVAGCQIANTDLTSPTHVCFSVAVWDLRGGLGAPSVIGAAGYSCVQPETANYWCASGSCNFDNYTPNLPAAALVQTGPGFSYQGAWSSTTAYTLGGYGVAPVVTYGGSTWIAVAASTDVTPGTDTTKWQLLGTGATGPAGSTGATGSAGANGTNGSNGSNGSNGNSVLNGAGAPSSGTGNDGDFYINTTSSCLYGPKASGAWLGCTTLIGPTGTAGANGTNGTNGTNGSNGSNGNSVLNGTGAPSSGTGNNGDFYVDTAAACFYGPKASGAWPGSCTTLSVAGTGGLVIDSTETAAPVNPSRSTEYKLYVDSTSGKLACLLGTSGANCIPGTVLTLAGSSGDLQTNNGTGALGSVPQSTFLTPAVAASTYLAQTGFTRSSVVALWSSCGGNFMKGDGTCSSGTGSATGWIASPTPTNSQVTGTVNNDVTETVGACSGGTAYYASCQGTSCAPSTVTAYSTGVSVTPDSSTYASFLSRCLVTGYDPSAVTRADLTFQVATPTHSPDTGSYSSTQNVTVATSTTGSPVLKYCTDAVNTCAPTSGSTYSSPVAIASTSYLRSIGTKTNYANSAVKSALYTITAGLTFIQSASHNITSGTTSSTVGNGVGSGWSVGNVTSGDLLFVAGVAGNPGTTTAADTLGTSLTCTYASGLTNDIFWCYGKATSTGADLITVTTTYTLGSTVIAMEFRGQNATTPLDQNTSGNLVSGSTWTWPSITTTAANSVIIACGGNNGTNNTYTAGSGYTIPTNGQAMGSGQSGMCEYEIVSSTGTYAPTATLTTMAGSGITLNFK